MSVCFCMISPCVYEGGGVKDGTENVCHYPWSSISALTECLVWGSSPPQVLTARKGGQRG